ncbi:50S ribosomal protein L17 [Parabacteroides sp. Marseille-P3160]|uniref:50S ribosomal protein L17 n=1 Tax=Parabacteroides sp. Marseille-P3160 TaxID=1917887 RepID=UPI0009B9440D|nr:50S ribosomal protein L17 [Parabacteroides sp. Marseille-P3160]
MRHNKKINHLGRTNTHRDAMLSNMASSLIKHKRIFTTTAKAKALRKFVEPIITKSKEDTTHSRRLAFKVLQNKYAVTELFNDIAQKVADRPGGYTRIIKTGARLGDNAAMCFIELVDYDENMLKTATSKNAPKTRRSRRKSSPSEAQPATAAPAEAVAAPVPEAAPEVSTPETEAPAVEPKATEEENKSAE